MLSCDNYLFSYDFLKKIFNSGCLAWTTDIFSNYFYWYIFWHFFLNCKKLQTKTHLKIIINWEGPSHRRFSHAELSTCHNLEHGQRKTLCSLHPLSPSDLTHLSALAASTSFPPSGSNPIKSASASVSAAGSNRSSPASTPIPSPIPSPVPSRDPSPCNHHRTSYRQRDSLTQQDFLGSTEHLGGPPTNNNNNNTNGSTILFQQRTSPSQSTGSLLSLNNNNKGNSSPVASSGGAGNAGSSNNPNTTCSSPTSCRQLHHHHRDYSPPKVLFHSGNPDLSSGPFTGLGSNGGSSGSGGNGSGILVEGDSLGLLSGKNPDEDNCSTTSTLGDGPGPPDNSSGNSNSLRLSPVTFTLQEPPDINEPYFSADEEVRVPAKLKTNLIMMAMCLFNLISRKLPPLS